MEHLTPAELLRFLEKEAASLQSMSAKISNELHCLQVEEELFIRQLSNLEKQNTAAPAAEDGQTGKDVNDRPVNDELSQDEGPSETLASTPVGSTEPAPACSPTRLESPATYNSSEGDEEDPTRIVELENDQETGMELQGQQQEQEEVKESPQPHRTSGKRASRRPARFLE